jgi:hypothetical protein
MRFKAFVVLFAVLFSVTFAFAQDAASNDQNQSLGDFAKKVRAARDDQSGAQYDSGANPGQSQSLGDIARKYRANKEPDVVVTDEDAKTLFKEIDAILKFASQDAHLPIRTPVKHKVIGRDEVDKMMADYLAKDEERKKIQQSELVMKKFGLLPANFELQKFYATSGHELAGFYAFDDKTMYLLNWIELSKQEPVMAHELTHALQDQNFDLPKWNGIHGSSAANKADTIDTEARLAAVEGQAMVTFLDYMIRPSGRTLADIPNAVDTLRSIILSSYDSGVSFHNAPPLLKETTYFPYLDGFAFEMEVQKREGTDAAFAGVFRRPPHNTHEIIHPEDYIARARPATFALPDLTLAMGANYKPYDSGEIGELDVRIMATSFGRENDAYTVAEQWNGGSYQAVLQPSSASKPAADLTPRDLGLVYVSKWKTYVAAARFAQLYETALLTRTKAASPTAPTECPKKTECAIKWSAHFTTDDGPVTMEVAKDNTLVITQGLQESAVTQVKQALAHSPQGDSRASAASELSLKFAALPQMRALREQVLEQIIANAGRF